MKSDKDKLYIKIVELNEIYNFVVRFLFEIIYSAKNFLLNLKFPDFEIQRIFEQPQMWSIQSCSIIMQLINFFYLKSFIEF
jgi:hypothetical protein